MLESDVVDYEDLNIRNYVIEELVRNFLKNFCYCGDSESFVSFFG